MWINERTGKGWDDSEEQPLAEIMSVSRLDRIQSIQLWKRCAKNVEKAVDLATRSYPPMTEGQRRGVEKMLATQRRRSPKGAGLRVESVQGKRSAKATV